MDVIIIEDEILLAEALQQELLALDASIKVIKRLTSVVDSIEWLKNNRCDLIFSDIELCDGNSFSIFKTLDINIPVVFTTAYDQYAIKAFETNSIGYLLKPIESDDLNKVLDKFRQNQLSNPLLHQLVDQLASTQVPTPASSYLNRVILTLGNVQKPVSVADIVVFMADDRYLFAITREGKKYYYDATLSHLDDKLDPHMFFRANRRFSVNKNFIDEIKTINRSRLMVNMLHFDEEEIVVSYSRSKDFKEWILS